VVAWLRRGGEKYWQIVLPDASHMGIACRWTDHPERQGHRREPEIATRATPAALRALLALMRALLGVAMGEDRPCRAQAGDIDGTAAEVVRDRGGNEGLGRTSVARRERRATRGGAQRSGNPGAQASSEPVVDADEEGRRR